MARACPTVNFSVDEKTARIGAFFTLILMLVFIFTPWKWIIFVLAADFFLRVFLKGKGNPLAVLNRRMAKALELEPSLVNAGPKLFAARIGFICCVLIAILYIADLMTVAYALSVMIALFASLESFLGYCVGCRLYSLIPRKT
ncbi:MAG: DUF4395 domain-containing protein [Candidatus Tantalella remota]|nr:DUF4395 domain-containing protein [Candidatus Tantalella remota]